MEKSITTLSEPISKALDFLSDIVKPPIKELSEILTDQVRLWRFKNQITLIQRAEDYVRLKGISPKKIPVKTLVPLLENASFEEEETLKDMWVKLLVNAIDPANAITNHIVFIEILKQLSPIEASVLNYFYERTDAEKPDRFWRDFIKITQVMEAFNIESQKNGQLIMENLMRLQLIEPRQKALSGKRSNWLTAYSLHEDHTSFRITYLGGELIRQTSLSTKQGGGSD